MKTAIIQTLDENELECAAALQQHVSRPEALIIVYLASVNDAHATGIGRGTGLSQPAISIAAARLAKRGWVTHWVDDQHTGRGAPMHIYRLATPIPSIIEQLKNAVIEQSASMAASLDKIKEMIKS